MSDDEFGPLPRWRRDPGKVLSEEDRARLDSIANALGHVDLDPVQRAELLDAFFEIAARYAPDPRMSE
jgi:hypothetical protein